MRPIVITFALFLSLIAFSTNAVNKTIHYLARCSFLGGNKKLGIGGGICKTDRKRVTLRLDCRNSARQ